MKKRKNVLKQKEKRLVELYKSSQNITITIIFTVKYI